MYNNNSYHKKLFSGKFADREERIAMNGKRIYKSEHNKRIAGVCGGIADYFGINPTIVRIIWFVFTSFYGIGVALYIICSLVMPSESAVMSQMREESEVTIDSSDRTTTYGYDPAADPEDGPSAVRGSTVVEFDVDSVSD